MATLWQVAKNKIEEYTTSKWKHKWMSAPQYKRTKLFHDSLNKNKSKYILKMDTYMLSTWVKSITGRNNLAYFQSKLNPEIDPTCRLGLQANETLPHLMTDCEATTSLPVGSRGRETRTSLGPVEAVPFHGPSHRGPPLSLPTTYIGH